MEDTCAPRTPKYMRLRQIQTSKGQMQIDTFASTDKLFKRLNCFPSTTKYLHVQFAIWGLTLHKFPRFFISGHFRTALSRCS